MKYQYRFWTKRVRTDSPGQESYFVPSATTLFLKLKVIDRPSAFIFWQGFRYKVFVAIIPSLLDDDLSRFFVKVEDDVFVFLLQLEILEYGETFGVNRNT
jgi:hypothetical protein